MHYRNFLFALMIGLDALFVSPAFGQGDRGIITGVVADTSGAPMPDVEIIVTNQGTNQQTTVKSNTTGNYVIQELQIGDYLLSATRDGFRSYRQSGIAVRVNDTVRIDIKMEIGQMTQEVVVAGQAPILQSETAEVGTTVDAKQFTDLPLTLGGTIRNASSFAQLNPGVDPSDTWGHQVAGGPAGSHQVYFDGISLSRGDYADNAEINPSVDAIAEFKLISSNYSAEFSHAMSGVTSFTMKSGTNDLHGSAFWFNSIEKFNARSTFQSSLPPYKQNEGGFTIGGPVVLPKIYNGRNKTFFFGSLDMFYLVNPSSSSLLTVPTAAMREGDFSAWAAAGNGNIYDPATGHFNAQGQYIRDAFPNNVVPQSRFSRVSKNLLPMIPQPLTPGVINNQTSGGPQPNERARTGGFKIDHEFNTAHRVSFMFNITDNPRNETTYFASLIPFDSPVSTYTHQQVHTDLARLNYNWIISPNTLNHFAAGISRFRNPLHSIHVDKGFLKQLGLTGLDGDSFPSITFSDDYFQYGNPNEFDNYYTNFTYTDTLELVRSNHSIKVGFELQAQRNNLNNRTNTAGTFNFDRLSTGLPGIPVSGNPFASLLLGDVMNGSALFPAGETGTRGRYYSPWVNDDWKVTPKLTLNLGVRWEIQPPFSDPQNRLSWMNPGLPNPAAGGIRGAYEFLGHGPGRNGSSSIGDTHWGYLAPRLGLAYRLFNRTVMRVGYGIFYGQIANNGNAGVPTDGYSVNAAFASANAGETPAFNWDQGFPQNFPRPPVFNPSFANGLSAVVNDPTHIGVVPYTQQYNFTLEQQVTPNTSVSAGYVGNLGRKLVGNVQLNQVNPAYLSLGDLLNKNILDPAAVAAGIPVPFPGFVSLWGAQATVAQALRPYPQYGSVLENDTHATYFSSSYQSLQIKATKRASYGFSGTLAYTFSKFLSNTGNWQGGPRDAYNRNLDWGPDGEDRTHILTMSFVYELPVGRGKPLFANLGSGLDKLVGGWVLSGIESYTSGDPLYVYVDNSLPLFNAGNNPNVLSNDFGAAKGSGRFDPGKGDLWLSPAAFAAPGRFQFGNAPIRLNYHGPFQIGESIALLKDTAWRERFRSQFRMEISNPLNRTVFQDPNTQFGSASFGVISSANPGRQIQFGLKLFF